ncbi:signal peptidase I [Anatilimnocola aggregata]|uniref:Signal peptidase I n=1 Tax=Anatilimnocola aggregata TaxID=2528021 RepID=A0A517YAZ1_9BACT|nr:signal peptidase I [Anatilimnocola aggregata]QDU27406.1 signal peptidase I [Anatilimnocola aggregata]
MATSAQIGNSIVSQASALSLTGERVDFEEQRLRRTRQAIAAIVVVLVAFVAARIWCLEGLLFPVHISGASMGETLSGIHYRVKCEDCGVIFRCDALDVPQSNEAICPHCGYAANQLKERDLHAGDQVLIDHWVYLLGRPRRGELVAFTHPDDDSQRVVKRIVGLPGEQIAIRRGDIYVNGQPWQKSLNELRGQAILVSDERHPTTKSRGLPAHWQPASKKSHWLEREQAFIYSGKRPPDGKNFDWLSFRNWQLGYTPETRTLPSTVLDHDSYNQDLERGAPLNDVSDLLLTCRASVAKYGCLVFAATDGADRFEVHMCHDEQKLKLFQNGTQTNVTLLPHRRNDEPIDIQFALCDQRVLFGMDGREVLRQPYTRTDKNAKQTEPQLEIGGAGARIRISKVKVWRDIYYLEPLNTARAWHAEEVVPPHHYLVLGDNPTVSIDSRQWPHAEVPLANILGRVVRPFWIR